MTSIITPTPPFSGCKGFTYNTTTNSIINYQRQKVIWNTCRVSASEYFMNKAALSVYQRPEFKVNWNQSSDRVYPHVQKTIVPSHGNSVRRTLTSHKPGAGSPGGVGCDIKHNSYNRYLNRLKGKDLRGGYISRRITDYVSKTGTIPFDPALPIYGGKYYKTNIVKCFCAPSDTLEKYNVGIVSIDKPLGNLPRFQLGDYIQCGPKCIGLILDVEGNRYTLQYFDELGFTDKVKVTKYEDELAKCRLYKYCFAPYKCGELPIIRKKDVYPSFEHSLEDAFQANKNLIGHV